MSEVWKMNKSFHAEKHLVTEEIKEKYSFEPRGVLKNDEGEVVGMWMKGKRGKRYFYLFEKPIQPEQPPYRIEYRDLEVGGKIYPNQPVKVYTSVCSVTHWGKKAE